MGRLGSNSPLPSAPSQIGKKKLAAEISAASSVRGTARKSKPAGGSQTGTASAAARISSSM